MNVWSIVELSRNRAAVKRAQEEQRHHDAFVRYIQALRDGFEQNLQMNRLRLQIEQARRSSATEGTNP